MFLHLRSASDSHPLIFLLCSFFVRSLEKLVRDSLPISLSSLFPSPSLLPPPLPLLFHTAPYLTSSPDHPSPIPPRSHAYTIYIHLYPLPPTIPRTFSLYPPPPFPVHTQRLVRILPRIYGLLCALIESSDSQIRAVLAHLFLQRIGPTLGVALPPNSHLASGAASTASSTAAASVASTSIAHGHNGSLP